MTREIGNISTYTSGIHNLVSHISCIFLLCFLGGLSSVLTGIRILRAKKITVSWPKPSIFEWNKPVTHKGKNSKYYGVFYVSFGILLLFMSVLMLFGDIIM